MRAIYLPELEIMDTYQIKGEKVHHLVNVIRIELAESLLLLNEKGLVVHTKVDSVSKKEIFLSKLDHEQKQFSYQIDLALGAPKKDALELSLKEAVELGLRKIYLVKSEYTQMKLPDVERIQSLMISALEQSNASFLPEIIFAKWTEIPFTDYKSSYLMDSQTDAQSKFDSSKDLNASYLLIVGPEGGFSPSELGYLRERPQLKGLRLPTPILRTPTAIATGVGILLSSMLDG